MESELSLGSLACVAHTLKVTPPHQLHCFSIFDLVGAKEVDAAPWQTIPTIQDTGYLYIHQGSPLKIVNSFLSPSICK